MTPDSLGMPYVQRLIARTLGGDVRFQRLAEWELRWIGLFTVVLLACLFLTTTLRRQGNRKSLAPGEGNSTSRLLPRLWLGFVPLLIGLLVVDAWAYSDRLVAPLEAVVINALAREDGWEFTYPNGRVSNRTLTVPRGRPVRLVLTALQGIRSLRMDEPRVSATALAGRFTTTWFKPERLGEFPIASANGPDLKSDSRKGNLAAVTNTINVMEAQQFEEWLSAPPIEPSAPVEHR